MNATTFYIIFFGGLLSLLFLIITWAIFGGLILQRIKRLLLASKGYVEVEHISATGVRNYFILKPKDNKFDMREGFYHYIPETVTRKGAIFKKVNPELLNKSNPEIDDSMFEGLSDTDKELFLKRVRAEFDELKGLYKVLSNLRYDPELLTRKMGMPVITYYADNPDPINFADRKKIYGSGVIKDMYLRLLMTQRYKDFRLMLIIMLIALAIIGVAIVGLYYANSSTVKSVANCVMMYNQTASSYIQLLNSSMIANTPPSPIII